MFPVSSKREYRGKSLVHEDLIILTDLLFDSDPSLGEPNIEGSKGDKKVIDEDYFHLGFFLNRKAVYKLLKLEGQNHLDNENMEYYLQMEIWKGNIGGAIKFAKEREELTDWLVSMAPLASHGLWLTICEEYARQLEMEGQYHKAATYYLACHKVYDAIELFKRHRLYKEAISLAKVRLSSMDPVFEDLYTVWAQQLMKDGNYEQAAKCQLAMLQVKEASNLLAKRYDLSSLQTAAHISFHANEEQEGLMYAQKVINQNLLQHDWSEAYKFIYKHHCLMSFLLVTNLHELLVKELCGLVPDTVKLADNAAFSKLKEANSDDVPVPEFILDYTELDPVSPWEPHHIGGHTFPHHVLKSWYIQHKFSFDKLNTEETYKTLNLLNAVRQSQVDVQQLIIQCSIDMTLCLLSLLRADTQQAIIHLLQAVASVHEAKQSHLLQAICRLFLPLGPKYLLKLQQEVTAMKVVISVDTNTDLDSSSKSQTTKRFISEMKEDGQVFNNGVRCRELDCLRAFYYLCVLNHLKEILSCDANKPSGVNVISKDKNTIDLEKGETTVIETECDKSLVVSSEIQRNDSHLVRVQSESTSKEVLVEVNSKQNNAPPENGSLNDTVKKKLIVDKNESSDSHKPPGQMNATSDIIENGTEIDISTVKDDLTGAEHKISDHSQNSILVISSVDDPNGSSSDNSMKYSDKDTHLTQSLVSIDKLKKLSQGVLWNLQAKRFALTETLGYIHKAISQMLLSQNSSTNNCSQRRKVSGKENTSDSAADADTQYINGRAHPPPPHLHHTHSNGAYMETCNPRNPQTLHLVYTKEDSISRGRKVFWQDEPYSVSAANHIPNILSPNKYINMPDEWYDLPVEEKYVMPYISLPVLKEEEEYVMHELKKGTDNSQVPFPNPQECVFLLVEICRKANYISTEERDKFINDVIHWSLNYAVSSNQQQVLNSLWHPQ